MRNSPLHDLIMRRRADPDATLARTPENRDLPEALAAVEEKPVKKSRKEAVTRDLLWYETQILDAKEDRKPALMHPSQSFGLNARHVSRHAKRWDNMCRVKKSPTQRMKGLFLPGENYKTSFMKTLAIERNDEVEPEIPTGVVEVWRDRAAVADQMAKWRCDSGSNALRSSDTYMRLSLPSGMESSELLLLSQYDDLAPDEYRSEDIIHIQRRAVNRELKGTGDLAAEVDSLEDEGPPWWLDYIPHVAGMALPLIGGFIFMASRGG